jgi:hypothetical protein
MRVGVIAKLAVDGKQCQILGLDLNFDEQA